MTDIREYERLARESGAFRDIELDILVESIQIWAEHPDDPNSLLELRDGPTLAGFAVMCRAPNTEFTFDVLALCIGRSHAGGGVGPRLVELIERHALAASGSAIVRFESSSRKERAMGPGLLASLDYSMIGHIPDFYERGDDYFMFAKHLFLESPEQTAARTGATSPEGGPEPPRGDSVTRREQ